MAIDFEIDPKSGVPFYRQIIDLVKQAIVSGRLQPGDQLPTVRQLAVDLSINPNTVARSYQILEIEGIVNTQMGTGTFIADKDIEMSDIDRRRNIDTLCTEFLARAAAYGFTLDELIDALRDRREEPPPTRPESRRPWDGLDESVL